MLLASDGMDGVARASKRTDVYALGIIAHEVTTDTDPDTDPNPLELSILNMYPRLCPL